jgi:hypothetical protein
MRKLAALIIVTAFCFVTACTVGEADEVVFVDTDGDGAADGVDTDGDGDTDFSTPSCPTCAPGATPICDDPLVDSDADGEFDGLDLDCDGNIDIPFDGGGGGSTNQCISTGTINGEKQQVSCTDGACECRVNDQLTSTCTAADPAFACSTPGNCCGF